MNKHGLWTRGVTSLLAAVITFLGGLTLSGAVWAATSPLEIIRSTTNNVLRVIADPTTQRQERHEQQIENMWDILLPKFDTENIAQRSLGLHWKKLTEDQRQEFTRLYLQLVKKSYGNTLKRYTANAEFFFDREHIEGDQAEVYTRIKSPSQAKAFSVVYRLHKQGEKWLIYDVVAENISLVQNYRNQFSRIASQSSVDGVIDALKRKLAELAAT
ncbi:MAG: phospholipid-binding protein MlaC [Candidatus Binatia bacterium]